jgi:aspartate/methionine/tyrosine aminotransferase
MAHFARRTNWNLATNAYTQALEEHRRSGKELLDLTASNPTNIGLRYNEQKLLQALARPEALTYEPVAKGLLPAREAIVGYYAGRGVSISPDDLILTTSTSEAYSFVFRLLCDPGDGVLVPAPSYPLFDFLADLQDVRLTPYELVYDHGWQMDFHSLNVRLNKTFESHSTKTGLSGAPEQNCPSHPVVQRQADQGGAPAPSEISKRRAVLVVHPNNPTGSFVKAAEAAQLRRFCAENNLALIADEVFLDYSLNVEDELPGAPLNPSLVEWDAKPASFASSVEATEENDVLTFTLSGLSKISGLPQMKVAWIAVTGPDELKREALARLEVIADTYLSMNAPVQWAIPAMLEEGHSIQQQLMARIRANLAELDRQLMAQKLCTHLRVEGGWYAVLRVPVTGSDEELSIALLRQTGVLVQPGHFYDFATDGYLVLSLITPQEIFADGLLRLLRFIAQR